MPPRARRVAAVPDLRAPRGRDPGLDDPRVVRVRATAAEAHPRPWIPFESGVSLGPPPTQRFTVSFYLTAMLFIVFDIEIVFLYPLAVVLNDLGWFASGS